MLYGLFGVIAVIAVVVFSYLQHPKFGRLPDGERLAMIERSPNYVDGVFQNLVDTPMFTEDKSFIQVLFENLGTSGERLRPVNNVPSVKTDLLGLDPSEDLIVWMGHSSFYIQLGGRRILVDPVFSDGAAPLSSFNRAYAGTHDYSVEDVPAIDALLITHDHWDHLDYASIVGLQPKVAQVVTALGVGAYFEQWEYEPAIIREGDWYDSFEVGEGLRIHLIPARHYSGRMLTRSKTLWAGFVLETPERRILISGDSGYGAHFTEIGQRFEGFDLVSLDTGQYDPRWAYIHMTPEEASQAAVDLGARALLPAHVGKFTLAKHPWDEPFERITAASAHEQYKLMTPMIGEPVHLSPDIPNNFGRWWH